MIPFSPDDPFPLLAEGSATPREEQEHSELVDEWLGLRTQEIEAALAPTDPREKQLWIGLPVRTLLTPYTEIRTLLSRLGPRPGHTIVDLGAGYGRMAFVIGRHYPGVRFIGYEYVPERVDSGNRALSGFSYPNVELRIADLAAAGFEPEDADFYFLYDYGTREAIEKTLQDLKRVAARQPIQVIGRGRASRDAIERVHPWLSQVHPPRHFPHYSVYSSHA